MEIPPPFVTFLITNGAWLMVPLATFEGPIVSIAAGFLCAQGYVGWLWTVTALVLGDFIGDLFYYWIGWRGGRPLSWVSRRAGWRDPRELTEGAPTLTAKALVVGKWTHAVGVFVMIYAGITRMPPATYALVSLIATLPKSLVLFGVGYLAPEIWPVMSEHWVSGIAVTLFAGVGALGLLYRQALRGRSRPSEECQ